ncbi:hypothetical protein [Carnobacterium inhibens]|uniref:Uncharacterized protein n=1 Tax=Carnobacterium inhibens subsp. gilichinskyi TaxID=1266845 RepID=U5SDP7_9LACT|nr:hypothetical protein [Carnobacterium inhibens]AGY81992.1 hypothetical protein Q783_07200 [Carnobacterium inhibens subsp. gilichinskyi]
MKRYVKLIIIAVVILLSIGVYYIQPMFSADERPEFKIIANSGDETLSENMFLKGYYSENVMLGMGIGDDIKITPKGTTYYSDSSNRFQSQLSGSDYEKINQLQEDYRSFMRGKEPSLANFFEDDTLLAYAELTTNNYSSVTEDEEFKIEVLNKKTNKESSFSVDLPKSTNYSYMYIEDIEVANNQLIIVTNGYSLNNENEQDEHHFYSISLPNEKIEKDESLQLDLVNLDGKQIQYVELLSGMNTVQTSKFLVYRVEIGDEQSETELYEDQEIYETTYELIGVNIETGEQFLIDLSDEVGNQALSSAFSIEKDILYFYKKNKETITIYTYFLEQKELREMETAELSEAQKTALKEEITLSVHNGTAFFVNNDKIKGKDQQIMAFDLESGKAVFEGSLIETKKQSATNSELYLYEVNFQE